MSKNLQRIALLGAILAVLFFVGSQYFSQRDKHQAETESAEFARRVSALCVSGDPAVIDQLRRAGICDTAQQIEVTKGEQGERGEDGLPGKDGRDGRDGEPGPPGRDGSNGRDGSDGKDGVRGEPGPKGETGARGPQGEPGAQGPKGDPGAPGKDGANGKTPIRMTCRDLDDGSEDCTVTEWKEG